MRPSRLYFTLFLLLLLQGMAAAAVNPRYGFVGTGGKAFAQKFGATYYALEGNYNPATGTAFSSVHPDNDPPAGFKVLRKVAKLNVRIDALGQTNEEFKAAFEGHIQNLVGWYNVSGARPAKPQFTWYAPNAAALAAAESLQIVNTIRREKQLNPAITGTVWEIGNEPNFFPALLPAEYAAIYANYHRIIKREDSTAKIAFGPLFIRETGEDMKPMMREMLVVKLTNAGALALLGQARFDSLVATVDSTLFSRIFNLGTAAYVSQAFTAMGPTVRPDYISIHVYPFDDRAPVLTKAIIQTRIDSLIISLSIVTGGKPVWITEFGNVNPSLSATAVASAMGDLIDIFTANAGIGNLFYYKGTGADQQLDLISGLGASTPAVPLTRLGIDSAFTPANGNFSCSNLNAIGNMYYLRAVGVTCDDGAPAAAPVPASPPSFATGIPTTTALTWSVVPGATQYRVEVATEPTFTTPVLQDAGVPGPARAVGPLANGTDYYWRVRGRNFAGNEGPWSATSLFTTVAVLPAAPVLTAPASFAVGVSAFAAALSWEAVVGATSYRVQLATETGFAAPLINDSNVTGTSRAAGLLAGNTAYYWRVRARGAAGTGDWSQIRQFTTGALPLPDAPILVSPANLASLPFAPVQLRWNRATYAATYQVQISNTFAFTAVTLNDSSLTDTTKATTSFSAPNSFWRVRARNASGPGSWSEIRNFQIQGDAILPGRLSAFRLGLHGRENLRFNLSRAERVTIRIFDVHGTKLFSLDETMAPGPHELALPALPGAGVRLLDVRIGGARETLKIHP
jgi:hypothetical protein